MSSSADLEQVELFVSWFALEQQLKVLHEQIEALNDALDDLRDSL